MVHAVQCNSIGFIGKRLNKRIKRTLMKHSLLHSTHTVYESNQHMAHELDPKKQNKQHSNIYFQNYCITKNLFKKIMISKVDI